MTRLATWSGACRACGAAIHPESIETRPRTRNETPRDRCRHPRRPPRPLSGSRGARPRAPHPPPRRARHESTRGRCRASYDDAVDRRDSGRRRSSIRRETPTPTEPVIATRLIRPSAPASRARASSSNSRSRPTNATPGSIRNGVPASRRHTPRVAERVRAPRQRAERARRRRVALLHQVAVDDGLSRRSSGTPPGRRTGANKPPRLMARLIEFFSRSGDARARSVRGRRRHPAGAAIARGGRRRARSFELRPALGSRCTNRVVRDFSAERDGAGLPLPDLGPSDPGGALNLRPRRAPESAWATRSACSTPWKQDRSTSWRPTRRTTRS